MYESYWGLKLKPFQNTPDPRFLYYTAQHKDAFLKLEYAIKEKVGAALLVGLWGCGKTLILHGLLNTLNPKKYHFVLIDYPPQDRLELLTGLLAGLGDKKISAQRTDPLSNILMTQIRNRLMEHRKEGKETVVILDEAQLIKDNALIEELRLLLNLQIEDQFLLTLILSGQPELQESINSFVQFEQRIAVKCHLSNLTREDTAQYVSHRLRVAGCSKSLFSEPALDLIYEHSDGIPRRINRLCDLSLLAGSQRGVESIDGSLIQEQAQGLVLGMEMEGVPVPEPAPGLVNPPVPKPAVIPSPTQPVQTITVHGPGIDDEESKQLYETLLLITENIFNQVRLKEEINIQPVYKVVEQLVGKVQAGDNALLACVYRTATVNYLIGHSVDVCILTLKLGIARGMDKKQLLVLGLGSLLHDVGMVKPFLKADELSSQIKSGSISAVSSKAEAADARSQTL